MTDPNEPDQQQQPGYQQPGNQQPEYQQPGYQQPGYQQPGYQQPGYQQPGYQQPPGATAYGAPAYGPPPQAGGYPAAPPPPQGPVVGPGGLVLDPASGLYLPPGTQLASVGRRIGAYFLAFPLAIVTLVIGYLIWGLIVWSKGTTPALQVLGMKVWRIDNGTVPAWGRMALREVVGRGILEGIVAAVGIVSFVLFLSNERRQSLHDMIAKTTVLYDPNKVLG